MLLPVLCEDRWVFVVNGTYCHLDSVLIDTLIAKGVDVSAIYDGVEISFAKKIALNEENNKLFLRNSFIYFIFVAKYWQNRLSGGGWYDF